MNKMKKILATCSFVVMIILVSFPQLGGTVQQQDIDGVIESNTDEYSIEIIDISFEGPKIIVAIKSIGYNLRTFPVDFYKSRIVGGNPTEPKYLGTYLATIRSGETIYIPKIWLGFGHYIIHVKIDWFDKAFQEVWWFLFFGWKIN